MKIAFRVDASLSIGTGHITRCLNLANELSDEGNECVFFTKAHHGNLIEKISSSGYVVHVIPFSGQTNDQYIKNEKEWLSGSQLDDAYATLALSALHRFTPDIFIIDHYSIDCEWEKVILSKIPNVKIAVIDDLCNREHVGHFLIDTTLGRQRCEYSSLIPEKCIALLGTNYALLNPAFARLRNNAVVSRHKTKHPTKILITMGGVDVDNVTGKVLSIINKSFHDSLDVITVILGLHCPHYDVIKEIAKESKYNIDVRTNVNNMPELMLAHDVSIGALGSTTWERCVLGVPAVNIAIANNQLELVEKLRENEFIVFDNINFSDEEFVDAWENLKLCYSEQVSKSFLLCDGYGLKRVVAEILNH